MSRALAAGRRLAAWLSRVSEGAVVLSLCGLAYLLGFVNMLFAGPQPYFQPVVDALYFDVWARRLAAGDWLGLSQGAFFQTPLYPYFLGVIYTLVGRNRAVVMVLQVAAVAATVAIIYYVARRLCGRAAATIAALAYALYGPVMLAEVTLLKVVWEGLLTAASLAMVLAAEDRPRAWRFALAGVLIALLAALRQNAMLLLPLAWVYLLWPRRPGAVAPAPAPAFRERLGRCAWLLLGAGLVMAPIAARNYAAEGDFVLIAASAGQTVYWENHHVEPGEPAYPPPFVRGVALFEEEEYRGEAERRLGHPLKTSEVSAYWSGQALRFALAEPGRYLRLCLKRAGEFFAAFEKPDNYNFYFARRFSPVLALPLLHFGVLAPAGLVGLLCGLGARRRLGLIAGYVLCYAGSSIPAFVNDRYRFPTVPLLCVGAGFLAVHLWGEGRALLARAGRGAAAAPGPTPAPNPGLTLGPRQARRLGRLAAACLAVAALAVACNWGTTARVQASIPSARINLSDTYVRLGRVPQAAQELELAVAQSPRHPGAHAALGKVYLLLCRYGDAARELEAAAGLNPAYVRPLDLARALAGSGDLEGALAVCRRALAGGEDANLAAYARQLASRLGPRGEEPLW